MFAAGSVSSHWRLGLTLQNTRILPFSSWMVFCSLRCFLSSTSTFLSRSSPLRFSEEIFVSREISFCFSFCLVLCSLRLFLSSSHFGFGRWSCEFSSASCVHYCQRLTTNHLRFRQGNGGSDAGSGGGDAGGGPHLRQRGFG